MNYSGADNTLMLNNSSESMNKQIMPNAIIQCDIEDLSNDKNDDIADKYNNILNIPSSVKIVFNPSDGSIIMLNEDEMQGCKLAENNVNFQVMNDGSQENVHNMAINMKNVTQNELSLSGQENDDPIVKYVNTVEHIPNTLDCDKSYCGNFMVMSGDVRMDEVSSDQLILNSILKNDSKIKETLGLTFSNTFPCDLMEPGKYYVKAQFENDKLIGTYENSELQGKLSSDNLFCDQFINLSKQVDGNNISNVNLNAS